jgi:parallel beta-helix repeat protein
MNNQKVLKQNNYAGKTALLFLALGIVGVIGVTILPQQIKAKSFIYADANASGDMDGSSEHPYKKIQDAIDKAAKNKKDVIVRKGIYAENITIKEDVEVVGENRDAVVIVAKDSKKAVVTMNDDTELQKVTVRGGEYGVLVEEDAHVSINKCDIEENKKDGVKVKEAEKEEKKQFEIFNSKLEGNGWNGIYAQERKSVIMDNEIIDNGRDGIELEKGSEAWIEDNSIRDNERDGIRLTLDGSGIYTRDNTFNSNGSDGIEVRGHGKSGVVSLEKSKFYNNEKYGIAQVMKQPNAAEKLEKGLKTKENKFYKNDKGRISPLLIF